MINVHVVSGRQLIHTTDTLAGLLSDLRYLH